ncbi:hypothetical protein BpHYR1_032630 [Brachionus plicatilis]|uniref:Uncharacterized protein n=1 Tax=Brachionus plicatilis TaxID=10195 RepID=A0A3M7PBX9_BRAPC|nr:hypothetical protein BpHYR1_032630 [Brachionus plicatilis]
MLIYSIEYNKMENYRKFLNPEHHCTTISISRVIDLLENQFPANFGRPFLGCLFLIYFYVNQKNVLIEKIFICVKSTKNQKH